MSCKTGKNRAFTLIELLVSIGILVVVMSFASVIFRVSIDAHRTALANSEIMQKLRAVTEQLNNDFHGLNKNGEIFIAWTARPLTNTEYKDSDLDGYERFDRIVFFADGDFQSYKTDPMIRGNLARISYMIARKDNLRAQNQDRPKRVLARTQHILTADPDLDDDLDPDNFTDLQWYEWANFYEYDKISLEQWKRISWPNKANMLSVISDIKIGNSTVDQDVRGAHVDPDDPNTIHMLLCEGVGEFKVQGWYEPQQRWLPEVDPDGNGDLSDSNFFLSEPNAVPGVLYPYPPSGGVSMNNINYPREQVDKAHFNAIPGLGRALKFTFTLYDSKGVIKEGRTFTHIVYLED